MPYIGLYTQGKLLTIDKNSLNVYEFSIPPGSINNVNKIKALSLKESIKTPPQKDNAKMFCAYKIEMAGSSDFALIIHHGIALGHISIFNIKTL